MSAFIVEQAHIDLLVEAFFRYEIPTRAPLTPDELGTILWKENHRSVNYRYNERRRTPRYQACSQTMCHDLFDRKRIPIGTVQELARLPLVVYKQCRCYGYQSCERDDWERSAACAYVHALEAAILQGLGMTEEEAVESQGWDEAPWGITGYDAD